MPSRNDARSAVLRETGSPYELERALKQLAPVFSEARREARHRASYLSKHDKRRLKAVKARRRIARHKENVSRTLAANL
jgi:hypothetical protein